MREAAARREAELVTARDAAGEQAETLRTELSEAEAARLAEVAAAEALRRELAGAQGELSEAEAARLAEAAAAEALRERLANADAELDAATLRLEEARAEAEETLTLLAAARAAQGELEDRLSQAVTDAEAGQAEAARLRPEAEAAPDLRERLEAALAAQGSAEDEARSARSEAERQRALLSLAAEELRGERTQGQADATRREALLRQVDDLRAQVAALREALGAAEGTGADAQGEIEDLRDQLSDALARRVAEERARADAEAEARAAEAAARQAEAEARAQAERARELEAEARRRAEAEAESLARYQSAFFAALSGVLGQREDIRVVGDRFVFSSEVLFEPGSDDLSPEGRREIAKVAGILQEVSEEIPPGTDWIVRVDGHTDDIPLSPRSPFADNWELSQARALSVVRFMSEELGIPPQRLSANGFGQYQPLDPRDTPEARAVNRRIELKLTER